jgi:uroporphyrinogen decarboxylase
MGVENLALAFLDAPEFVQNLLSVLSEKLTRLAVEEEAAGAQMVAVLEPTAMIVSPQQFKEFV